MSAQKRALVIGIDKYLRHPLKYCSNDAIDLSTALQLMGFETSLRLDCNLSELHDGIAQFIRAIEPDDLALFYFAGHGKNKRLENYLLPADYDCRQQIEEDDYIVQNAISIKYIMNKIYERKCAVAVYLFDCSRYVRETRATNVDSGLLPMFPPPQSLMLCSCAPCESTVEETRNSRNGCFMENLLKYISVTDKDMEVVMVDVLDAVYRQTDGRQLPYRMGCLVNKICLATSLNQERPTHAINSRQTTKWKQNGITIAGGHGQGCQLNQLSLPTSLRIDDTHAKLYVADCYNHRIVEWKSRDPNGLIVTSGSRTTNCKAQLHLPADVIVDKKDDSLIICDQGNRRVVRWFRTEGTRPKTIIWDVDCLRLAMDNNGDLYVSDWKKNEVRRWEPGFRKGAIVAGGNGKGAQLNQLDSPTFVFVDSDYSVYVSDTENHRVMKWTKGSKQGVVVAGGQGPGNALTQLCRPQGVSVDHFGTVYVADSGNNRIVRCSGESQKISIVVGGNGCGDQSNQFNCPIGISFDLQDSLYVLDHYNHRLQKFDVDTFSGSNTLLESL